MRAALAAMCCLATGCATIVAGGPDQVPVRTNPSGAYVYLDGQVVGRTPLVLTLDRSRTLGDIRIYYPGFHPVQLQRYKSLNLWIIGNFFLGMLPIIVDFATGNWQAFEEDEILLSLTPGQTPPPYGIEPQVPLPPPTGQPPTSQPPPPMPYGPPPAAPPSAQPR